MKRILTRNALIGFVSVLVILFFAFWAVEILKVRGTFDLKKPAIEAGGIPIEVGHAGQELRGREYLKGSHKDGMPLVVVLHGDAPGRKPMYQYLFASNLAAAVPGAPVIALLRPGYADPYGGESEGDRGWFAAGENYTPSVIHTLSGALVDLKSRFKAKNLVLVGHSGGATIAADVAAQNPGLIQQRVLVSCPCDVPRFRRHMAQAQRSPVWLLPFNTVSPLSNISSLSRQIRVTAISGSNDEIALPVYAENYVSRARERGIRADFVSLSGVGHEILLDPEVLSIVAARVKESSSE